MDFVNKLSGPGDKKDDNQDKGQESSSGGGFMGKINDMAGGGKESEKNEDALDKGVDFAQEKFMGQGRQDNESAAEQAKDEAISDAIRSKYKDVAGSDLPIKDKERF